MRVLARGTIRAIRLDENVPPPIAYAVRDPAAAVRRARGRGGHRGSMDRVREHALRAAATATLALEGTGNLSVSVIIGQVVDGHRPARRHGAGLRPGRRRVTRAVDEAMGKGGV